MSDCEGGSLEVDDFLFPGLSSYECIKPDQSHSSAQVQTLMNKVTGKASLMDVLSQHCFRHSGVQHWLIHTTD